MDDSASIRRIVKLYLRDRGHEFLEAGDAEHALRLLEGQDVELVITDVHMPGMDGVTFLRRLRSDVRPRLRDVPVLLMTSQATEALRTQTLAAGHARFLEKPVGAAHLVQAVDELLADRAA